MIAADGSQAGIMTRFEALSLAQSSELDLVEVSPMAEPPVVRIMDFGKFKYEQAKKDKQQKTKSKAGEMKEVRLGRSMKIDPHDVEIRVNQARQFLMEGYRVVFVQNFRGRELAYKSKGDQRMAEIAEVLADIGRVELAPRMNGKRMSMILVPDRAKIDSIKKKTGGGQKSAKPAEPKSADAKAAPAAPAAPVAESAPAPEAAVEPSVAQT